MSQLYSTDGCLCSTALTCSVWVPHGSCMQMNVLYSRCMQVCVP